MRFVLDSLKFDRFRNRLVNHKATVMPSCMFITRLHVLAYNRGLLTLLVSDKWARSKPQ